MMKQLFLTLLLATFCAATSYGQTMKALSYNTNGVVAYTSANRLSFTNTSPTDVLFNGIIAESIASGSGTNSWFSASGGGVETSLPIEFANNSAGGTRSNLSLGATWLTNTNVTNFRTAIGLGATNDVLFQTVLGGVETNNFIQLDNGEFNGSWTFISAVNFDEPAETRTNLGLPLPALTNTSNVTTMRALAGSTNTNQPYSGTFDFQDFSDNTVRLTISNGIILNIEFP
jgi:hypothetical protein